MGSTHVEESVLDVGFAHVIFHDTLEDAALGVENRQTSAEFLWEGEKIKFSTEATVITSLSFLESFLIGDKIFLRGPRSSVNSLQLVVGLVAAPVCGRGLGERETVADQPG